MAGRPDTFDRSTSVTREGVGDDLEYGSAKAPHLVAVDEELSEQQRTLEVRIVYVSSPTFASVAEPDRTPDEKSTTS